MKIRNYTPSDASKIDEIYERCHGHFNLPNVKHCIGLAVVESGGEIIALGAMQLIPEVILVLDNHRPKREQVKALSMLMYDGVQIADLHGFKEFYAFPDSESYAGVLKKHFGFEDGKHILIKRFDDGE